VIERAVDGADHLELSVALLVVRQAPRERRSGAEDVVDAPPKALTHGPMT
jgi:hypothetical protein